MKLTLLRKKEDFLMQILWKEKQASIQTIMRKFPYEKPSVRQLEKMLADLVDGEFAGLKANNGKNVYFPMNAKKKHLRFRVHYQLVAYFDGSFEELHKFLQKYDIQGIPVFPPIEDNITENVMLSTVRNFYRVKYPNAIIDIVDLAKSFANDFRLNRKKDKKYFIAFEIDLKKPARVAFIVIATASMTPHQRKNFKREHANKIFTSKTTMLHHPN